MDQHLPPRELRLLQNPQHLQSVVEAPARPQEVHDTALHHQDVDAAGQVKVPVLGNRHRPGTEPREEEKKRTGVGLAVGGGGRVRG